MKRSWPCWLRKAVLQDNRIEDRGGKARGPIGVTYFFLLRAARIGCGLLALYLGGQWLPLASHILLSEAATCDVPARKPVDLDAGASAATPAVEP